tara:strand:- start:850 stop:1011 length:162 start_codon:yes stop_codon:yes gene_type:complete
MKQNINNNYLILILSILLVTMIGCSDLDLLNSNKETISADEMNALKKVKELPK